MQKLEKNSLSAPKDIRIDRDGTWYYRGAEMVRKDIVNLFYHHIKQDQEGRYLIEYGDERYFIEVDDTPFIIKSVSISPDGEMGEDVVYLLMPDDSLEKLDPSTLRVAKDNSLYCTIERIGINARFSRSSYYQIARYIDHDSDSNEYYISLNGHHYSIGTLDSNYP
ncbi:MAG: DUF1285 domain-containing protein [Syntrophales bacterium LBB04]|nr:DUF1285 domain-containing protein [Syntrophales bacterium LBB04]